ncbi:MAG: patatin-like phospholipase family protein [Chitinophagaceae bacterium]
MATEVYVYLKRIKKIIALLLLLACNSQMQAQPIKNLVFEGAGMRGIAYCGAIRELEEKGIIKDVERVGGTSAGAITALALSLGYSADEIARIISQTNFKKFNDGRFMFAGGINRMNKYFGWYKGEQFNKWLEKLIAAKAGNENITFQELSSRGFKDLYVTATCLNRQQLVILSKETYPAMRIKDAVRISMSIPLYFEAVFIDSLGQVIDHPKNKQQLDVMTDGGLTGNFPIRIFDSSRYVNPSAENVFLHNSATIGFRIDREEQIANDQSTAALAPMPVGNIKEYASAFYNMIIEKLNRQALSTEDWQRTVSISDGSIGPRIRRLSKSTVSTLMENGRIATKNYLHYKD